ncbi:MAG: hypothetical protein PHH57_03530 [Candidatus Omnitrophica bacterium]|nr:hypothetical protein [Candidatus Omnitrophota bacterium]
MAKKKVFVSFDFENDKNLKNVFISQSKHPDSPFSVNDYSLQEAYPDDKWLSKAQSAIARCDLFIVLLGKRTHKAPGVLREVNIASGLRKERFQIRPQKEERVSLPDGGEVIVWKWKNFRKKWGQVQGETK